MISLIIWVLLILETLIRDTCYAILCHGAGSERDLIR
jgi:hypothetical protein